MAAEASPETSAALATRGARAAGSSSPPKCRSPANAEHLFRTEASPRRPKLGLDQRPRMCIGGPVAAVCRRVGTSRQCLLVMLSLVADATLPGFTVGPHGPRAEWLPLGGPTSCWLAHTSIAKS